MLFEKLLSSLSGEHVPELFGGLTPARLPHYGGHVAAGPLQTPAPPASPPVLLTHLQCCRHTSKWPASWQHPASCCRLSDTIVKSTPEGEGGGG